MEDSQNDAREPLPQDRKIRDNELPEHEEIILTGLQGTPVPIKMQDVTIVPSTSEDISESSSMKIFDVTDFGWETKSFSGKLVCMHISGTYIAYILKGHRTREGIVCVINHKTGAHSSIKVRRQVKDLSFAHKTDEIILAFVDNVGSLSVYEIAEEKGKLICNNILKINKKTDNQISESTRVIWCPYIPEEPSVTSDPADDSIDVSKVLVIIHDSKAQMWNIDEVTKEYGKGPLFVEDIKIGYQNVITDNSMPIKDAVFSPDGYALALASTSGAIQFFEVFSEKENVSPRCLHQWKPHDGRPLSCLYFLDDHKCPKSNTQFWKFALTGADKNQEIKLWSCVDWVCLQTIRFSSPSHLKAELDLTGSYFLLSDIRHKHLYILDIEQEVKESLSRFSSITEYFVDQPVLSSVIADVCPLQTSELDLGSSDGEKQASLPAHFQKQMYIKLIWISAKLLQECHICLNSSWDILPKDAVENIFQNSTAHCDKLSDMSSNLSSPDPQSSAPIPNCAAHSLPASSGTFSSPNTSITSTHQTSSPSYKTENVLLTPEDFITSSPSSAVISHKTSQEDTGNRSPAKISTENAKRTASSHETPCDKPKNKNTEHSSLKNHNSLPKADNISMSSASPKFDEPNKWTSLNSEENTFILNNKIKRLPSSSSQIKKSHQLENLKEGEWKENLLNQLQKLQLSVNKLAKLVPILSDSIRNNQNNISALQQDVVEWQQHMELLTCLQDKVLILDKAIGYKLDKTLAKEISSEFSKLDEAFSQSRGCDERMNEQSSSLAQTASMTIGNKLEKCVKNETKNNIIPCISNFLETFKHQQQQDLGQKLVATDYIVKESIGKLVRSKGFTESISNCVVTSIERHLHIACAEVSQNTVTPILEKSCQSLLQQLNDAFRKGIEEYIFQVDEHLKNQGKEFSDNNNKTVSSTLERANEIRLFTEQVFESCMKEIEGQMQEHVRELLGKQQEVMLTRVRHLVRQEIDQGLKNQAAINKRNELMSIRSHATTPLPAMLDLQMQQEQILQLIKQEQFSAAFQQALSAANLNLVLYTCKAVDPSIVFSQHPCPLQQPVILSLIQQLVADLSSNVDLKLRYVEEAVVHLDMINRVTREHGGAVLRMMHRKLSTFIQETPNQKLRQKVRMLILAIQSLCNS